MNNYCSFRVCCNNIIEVVRTLDTMTAIVKKLEVDDYSVIADNRSNFPNTSYTVEMTVKGDDRLLVMKKIIEVAGL